MKPDIWNALVCEYAPPFGAFLQSYEWGTFQESMGRSVERVHVPGTDVEVVAQAIELPLPLRRSYWYVPKGPLGHGDADAMVEALRGALPDAVFLRCEPTRETRFLSVPDVQPAVTTLVDLSLGEEAVYANMKPKTRYNAKLAQRKGVECRFVDAKEYGEDFWRLMQQTARRDGFRPHPKKYYEKLLLQVRGQGANAGLAMAFYEGRPIAGNITVDFAGTRTYLHGATSNLHRDTMAQYALHAFLMVDAIQKGLLTFDFWGIAPDDAPSEHPWAGITRYKLGYGGKVVTMPGTIDLPMDHAWYSAYRWVKSLRHGKIPR